jgi:hypothetical protein
MKYVYLLQSHSCPEQRYVGCASNLETRPAAHNYGQSPHTAKFRPRKVVSLVSFTDETRAAAFGYASIPVPAGLLRKNTSGRNYLLNGSGLHWP